MFRIKKLLFIFLLLTLSYSLSAQIKISNELSQKLHLQAEKNIKALPDSKYKVYSQLLKQYPDGLMAFLLASEENAKLLIANPNDIEQHYLSLNADPELSNSNLNENVVLSYICKITVSDERIEYYRQQMLDRELQTIKDKYSDMTERVRAVNLWCRKYMTFEQTSGRDLSPLDILNLTNVGRCEENQIFFVAAARSAGIPARPAFTPWWAHADNNHAWAEVLIEGQWYYLGACEPDFELNRSWFTSMIDKAVLIIAESALPDDNEEILLTGRYMSYINSTPYYSSKLNKSRKVKINCFSQSKAVNNAEISILVYNWGSLRPLIQCETDSSGYREITLSQGAAFVMAMKDSLISLQFLPESADDIQMNLDLTQQTLKEFACDLTYPKAIDYSWDTHPEYEKEKERILSSYNDLIRRQSQINFPDFHLLSDTLVQEIMQKSRFNKESFYLFIKNNPNIDLKFLKILSQMDSKIFYQATQQQYQQIYNLFLETQKSKRTFSDELLKNILSPVSYFEELPHQTLPQRWLKWRKKEQNNAITSIFKQMKKTYQVNNVKALAGLINTDQMQDLKYLNSLQFRMAAIAVLKHNFIPARLCELPNAILIYNKDQWQYFDIQKLEFLKGTGALQKTEITSNFKLSIKDSYGQILDLKENQLVLSLMQNGSFYENDIQPKLSETGDYICSLRPELYYLQVGYRVNGEKTKYQLIPVNLIDQPTFEKSLILDEFPSEWAEISEQYSEISLWFNEQDLDKDMILLIGDYDREMVRRLNDRIIEQNQEAMFLWFGAKISTENLKYYQFSEKYAQWIKEHPIYQQQLLTFYYNKEKKQWYYYQGMWDYLPKK